MPQQKMTAVAAVTVEIRHAKLLATVDIGCAEFFTGWMLILSQIQTSCRRAAATICPRPLLPLWVLKRLAPPSRPPRLQTAR